MQREREGEMEMEWSETPCGYETMNMKTMIEQAEEELQILETQHPNRFEYMKLELKSFIYLLHSQNPVLLSHQNNNMVSSSTATTQASSTRKKRKKGRSEMGRTEVRDGKMEQSKQKIQRKKRDRVEVVIERAQACLQKIQHFKTSF